MKTTAVLIHYGKIIALGPEAFKVEGKIVYGAPKVGDAVSFISSAVSAIYTVDGREYYEIDDIYIISVLKDNEEGK